MINPQDLTEQDITFLKTLKDKGIPAEQAYAELAKLKPTTDSAFTSVDEYKTGQPEQDDIKVTIEKLREMGKSEQDINTITSGMLSNQGEPQDETLVEPTRIQKGSLGVEKAYRQLGGRIKEAAKTTKEVAKEGIEFSRSGAEDIIGASTGEPTFDPRTGEFKETPEDTIGRVAQASTGLGKLIGGAFETVFSPFASPVGFAEPEVQAGIKKFMETRTPEQEQALMNLKEVYDNATPQEKDSIRALTDFLGVQAAKAVKPAVTKTLEKGAIALTEELPKAAKAVKTAIGDTVDTGLDIGKDTLKKAQDLSLPKLPKIENLEKAGSLLESTNKILPTKATEFMAPSLSKGKPYGQWMVERGIKGTPQDNVVKLVERFIDAKKTIDDAVLSVKGNIRGKEIKNVLDELESFYKPAKGKPLTKTQSANYNKILELQKKHIKEGLTGDEILNEVKRRLEREAKFDYIKENVSGNVRRANELASELRVFLTNELDVRGFPQFKELSKEVQLSRFLADSIGDKLIRSSVKNEFGLIDNLDLLGASINPKALVPLMGKRFFTSDLLKRIRTKFLAPKEVKELGKPSLVDIAETQKKLPKGTSKKAEVKTPIELPKKSQSSIDEAERARLTNP